MSRRHVIAALAVLALTCATAAFAANSAGFTDRGGDSFGGPDVSQVQVSSDDAGVVTVRVDVSNTQVLVLEQGVMIMLDTDQNPDTGSVFNGAEWALELRWTHGLAVYRANGDFFDEVPAPASVKASFSSPSTTFTFNAAELGITSGFNLSLSSLDLLGGFTDPAPDYHAFNYQLVAGTQPPALGADTRAPVVFAYKTKAKRGKTVELDYEVFDGRGESEDTITVYRNNKVVKTISYDLGDVTPFLSYYAKWKVPKKEKGKLKFCVRAADRAGNKSAASCAAITLS